MKGIFDKEHAAINEARMKTTVNESENDDLITIYPYSFFLMFFRFDLIFLILDPQDELYDRRLASHLVSLYHLTEKEAEEEFLVFHTINLHFNVHLIQSIIGIS